AEVQTKDSRLRPCGNDLEKRMPRACRVMPLVIVHLLSAEKTDRMISACGPEWIFGCFGETLDDVGMRRLLKNDKIRRSSNDCFRKRLLPPQTAKSDVVAQQPEAHVLSPGGTTT